MEESKQHCQTCDEWVDKVKYNDALDQDQCKRCMEGQLKEKINDLIWEFEDGGNPFEIFKKLKELVK